MSRQHVDLRLLGVVVIGAALAAWSPSVGDHELPAAASQRPRSAEAESGALRPTVAEPSAEPDQASSRTECQRDATEGETAAIVFEPARLAGIAQVLRTIAADYDFTRVARSEESRGVPTFDVPGDRAVPAQYRGVLGRLEPDEELPGNRAGRAVSTSLPATPGTDPLTGMRSAASEFTADGYGSGTHNAVVVKIDNAPAARPQAGLNRADIVFEEEVEGGITRFAAVFHSQGGTVGPIRSGRTTDLSLLASLGSPSLAYSGANEVFDALLLDQSMVHNFSASRTGGFERNSNYRFPSNLFAEVDNFAQPTRPPPPQFHYDDDFDRTDWEDASTITVDWGGTTSGWVWEADTAQWLRLQNGRAHESTEGRVSATNVVVVTVEEVDTGLTDSIGSPVPEYVFVGSGPALVFADGRALEGTWERPTLRDPAALIAPDGTTIALTPGRTWVELVVAGSTTWS